MSELVVVTGLGVVSPIGIGLDAVRKSLSAGRSGVRTLGAFDVATFPVRFGGEVADFDGKQFVRPRKSLKVMSREIQLAFAAADQAWSQSGIAPDALDPERVGVVFGSDLIQPEPSETAAAFAGCVEEGEFDFGRWGDTAMRDIYPLWMLKHLPNMPACHVGIAFDARGPNNTITLGEVSSLSAIGEAKRVIERGTADAMLAGGTGSKIMPTTMARNAAGPASRRNDAPERAARPFDADRDGEVYGEGAAVLTLEMLTQARRRGASALARVAGFAGVFGRDADGVTSEAVANSIERALADAGLSADDVGLVVAHGRSTRRDDEVEARAIRRVLGDVAVTAPSSYYGNLGSASGAVAAVIAVAALVDGRVPPTLNFERSDPACPVDVVHGEPRALVKPAAIVLNQTPTGQAAALVLTRE